MLVGEKNAYRKKISSCNFDVVAQNIFFCENNFHGRNKRLETIFSFKKVFFMNKKKCKHFHCEIFF